MGCHSGRFRILRQRPTNSKLRKANLYRFFELFAHSSMLLCLVLSSFFSTSLFAFNPTPQQIQQFQSLSPDEQKKLAESFGFKIPQSVSVQPGQSQIDTPVTQIPRNIEKEIIDTEVEPDSTEEKTSKNKN